MFSNCMSEILLMVFVLVYNLAVSILFSALLLTLIFPRSYLNYVVSEENFFSCSIILKKFL